MKATISERFWTRKKKRLEGERYIAEVIIPRIREDWLRLGNDFIAGRWCPITANEHPDPYTRVFITDRMDRAAGGSISAFNDNAKDVEEVVTVLMKAASRS